MPNFNTIPKLIGFGNYSITVDFTSLLQTIKEFERDCNLDLNPEFQRGYVWTQQQKERYVEFLLRGGNTGKDILFNYPDWLGIREFDKNDPILSRMIIVDGKQRLSAVMGFMQNEVKAFGSYYSEFTGHLRCINHLTFYINELSTRKEVLEWYLQLNSGGTVHTEEELNKVRRLITEVESF